MYFENSKAKLTSQLDHNKAKFTSQLDPNNSIIMSECPSSKADQPIIKYDDNGQLQFEYFEQDYFPNEPLFQLNMKAPAAIHMSPPEKVNFVDRQLDLQKTIGK